MESSDTSKTSIQVGAASEDDKTQHYLPTRPPSRCLSRGSPRPPPEGIVPSGLPLQIGTGAGANGERRRTLSSLPARSEGVFLGFPQTPPEGVMPLWIPAYRSGEGRDRRGGFAPLHTPVLVSLLSQHNPNSNGTSCCRTRTAVITVASSDPSDLRATNVALIHVGQRLDEAFAFKQPYQGRALVKRVIAPVGIRAGKAAQELPLDRVAPGQQP